MPTIKAQMAEIQAMDLSALRDEWRRHYRASPPRRLSRDLLIRGIAYKLQEKTHGGLSKAMRRRLRTLAKAFSETGRVVPVNGTKIRLGTRLVREWQGRTYVVTVTGDGFNYDSETYTSLRRYCPTNHRRALVRSPLLRCAAIQARAHRRRTMAERRKPPRAKGPATVRSRHHTPQILRSGSRSGLQFPRCTTGSCEAYIASQKHEGWTALSNFYDDGGVLRRHPGAPGVATPARRCRGRADRHDRRLQGRPADPDAVGFCPACGDLRSKIGLLRLRHPAVQHQPPRWGV